jgi:hypothetical protein
MQTLYQGWFGSDGGSAVARKKSREQLNLTTLGAKTLSAQRVVAAASARHIPRGDVASQLFSLPGDEALSASGLDAASADAQGLQSFFSLGDAPSADSSADDAPQRR